MLKKGGRVNSEIIAALNELRNEVRALRFDLKAKQHDTKTPRKLRHELRCKRICEMAAATGAATGLGICWECAKQVLMIINGEIDPPKGAEQTALKLRQDTECPKTTKTIWTIINLHHSHPVA
jgi:hypothetical protein